MFNLDRKPDGDLNIVKGKIDLVDDVSQRLASRLRMMRGEWFLDLTEGTPYFIGTGEDLILGPRVNLNLVRSVILQRVQDTDGIIGSPTVTLSADSSTRQLTIDIVAQTDEGRVVISL